MPNRTQSENLQLTLAALQQAGQDGLSVDEIKNQVFKAANLSKSDIKKLLDVLRSKGLVQVKVGKIDIRYSIITGHSTG
jgi:SOS-response transcriptional repressor LexA